MADTAGRVPRSHPSQACEHCRSSKIKCLPSDELHVCQKCRKSGLPCVWAARRPRKGTQVRGSKARISALEAKVDELVAQLVAQPNANEALAEVYPSPQSFASSQQGSAETPEALLGPGEGERLLSRFREMSLYFPFVVIPANACVASLALERPCLLLALLAVASCEDRAKQSRLEQMLRKALLDKIMLEGAKGLDLLAALLVYIAWYHFFYIPKVKQSSQWLHLATSMCFDLGLHLRPAQAVSRKVGLQLNHYRKVNLEDGEQHDDFFSREARRLYLGCYFLSNSSTWLTGKPESMQYCDFMRDCALSLGEEREYPTDEAIPHFIQLHRMAQECHQSLCGAEMYSMTDAKSKLLDVQQQLHGFRTSLPPILRHSTFIELAYLKASFYIHEMDLINPFADNTQNDPANTTTTDRAQTTEMDLCPHSSLRSDILLRCLQGARDFFETFLTIPASEYCLLSAVQWYGLIYATVIIYKLSVGLKAVPEWDVEIARNLAPLEMYLDTCCERMEVASSTRQTDGEPGNGDDLFSLMAPIWHNVKQTYGRLKRLPQEESAHDRERVHQTSFPSPMRTRSSVTAAADDNDARPRPRPVPKKWEHPCPAYPFWKT